MNPYLALNVLPEADDQAIRKAYLDAIKIASPEADPQRFQILAEAYERIKDEAHRHEYLLFNRTTPGQSPIEALQHTIAVMPPPKPLPLETLKQYLRSCARI